MGLNDEDAINNVDGAHEGSRQRAAASAVAAAAAAANIRRRGDDTSRFVSVRISIRKDTGRQKAV